MQGPFLGASAVVIRDGTVLLGLRLGAHSPQTWGFPGGKVEAGEDPADTVRRELAEETGLHADTVERIGWTSDLFAEQLHYVTLHHLVRAAGEPVVTEADKTVRWQWWPWNALPAPLFLSTANLAASGWRPG